NRQHLVASSSGAGKLRGHQALRARSQIAIEQVVHPGIHAAGRGGGLILTLRAHQTPESGCAQAKPIHPASRSSQPAKQPATASSRATAASRSTSAEGGRPANTTRTTHETTTERARCAVEPAI